MYARTDKGATVALIPKAGLQSMRHSLRARIDLSIDEVRSDLVRVLFLRSPAARLVSAYRFYKTIYEEFGFTPSPNAPQPPDVANWDAFIEHVRTRPDDPHWRPQIEVIREFQPTAIHRFEDIDTHWGVYHSRPFPHLNSSTPYEVGEIPDDIMARYTEEDSLWRGL